MFYVAPQHTDHANAIAQPWHPWPQTADPPHHQLNGDPRLGGLIKRIDQRWIRQHIELSHNLGGAARLGLTDFLINQTVQVRSQRHRSHQ